MNKIKNGKYTFLGEDGSLGLSNSKTYIVTNLPKELVSKRYADQIVVLISTPGESMGVYCVYSTASTFISNWAPASDELPDWVSMRHPIT